MADIQYMSEVRETMPAVHSFPKRRSKGHIILK